MDSLGRYLGVPVQHARIYKRTYVPIIERVAARLNRWNRNLLWLAGHINLAKSVLIALPIYFMNTTMIPSATCLEIERIICNFIWSSSDSASKVSLVKWDSICRPKMSSSLGFHKLRVTNKAFMMKLLYASHKL